MAIPNANEVIKLLRGPDVDDQLQSEFDRVAKACGIPDGVEMGVMSGGVLTRLFTYGFEKKVWWDIAQVYEFQNEDDALERTLEYTIEYTIAPAYLCALLLDNERALHKIPWLERGIKRLATHTPSSVFARACGTTYLAGGLHGLIEFLATPGRQET